MTTRWNGPGAVRCLGASDTTLQSSLTAMDYLRGLDQNLLAATSLVRPVTLSELAVVTPPSPQEKIDQLRQQC